MKAPRDSILMALAATTLVFAAMADQYYLFLLVIGALTVIVGVGLNVLMGLTGLVSFGHVGFYAIGAYATAALSTKLGWGFWWALPVSVLITGMLGALLGLVARYHSIGQFTAYKAEQILVQKRKPESIPIETLTRFSLQVRMDVAEQLKLPPPLPMFNYAELIVPKEAAGHEAPKAPAAAPKKQ